jgi:hypothetical protein
MTEDPDELISIYRAAEVPEAYLVKNLLGDAGIEAQVTEPNEPLAGLPIVPADVLVRRRDLAQAEAFVREYDETKMERAERPDWKCPACNATVTGAFDECDVCGALRPGVTE